VLLDEGVTSAEGRLTLADEHHLITEVGVAGTLAREHG